MGVARVRGDTALTVTGQRPDSVGDMSRQQVLSRELYFPSNEFRLGGVLAYGATGRHRYPVDDTAMGNFLIAFEEPDLFGVPQPLLSVVRRCLDRDPRRRPTPVLDDASRIERTAARPARPARS